MPTQLLDTAHMAKKKPAAPSGRDRIDLRADPELIARAERQAKRFGSNLSVYIREALTLRLERDEASDPTLAEDE